MNAATPLTASLAIALTATPTLADGPLQGTATWLYDVTTQDGDAIVEPGETAFVTLSILMEPDADQGVALAATIFDVLAEDDQGAILGWEYHNCLECLTGDLATTDGVSIFNINAGQLTAQTQPFTIDNPADVFTFEWQPAEYQPRDVAFTTKSYAQGRPSILYVWEWPDGKDWHDADAKTYPVNEAAITFTVVPAPASMLPLLLLARRRRARPPTEPRPSGRGHPTNQPHHGHLP
jgi:hypothetical protein